MFKRNKVFLFGMIIVLVASTLLVGCGSNQSSGNSQNGASGGTVKIGVVLPLTGSTAQEGTEVLEGFEFAREMINAKGGVWGKQVEFDKVDAPDPTAGATAVTQLANKRYKVIAGTYSSAISSTASEVAERNKIVYWEDNAVADNLTQRGYKYFYRCNYPSRQSANIIFDYIEKELSKKLNMNPKEIKIAVIYEQGEFGSGSSKAQLAEIEKRGLNKVISLSYDAKSTDLSSVVAKVKAAQPNVILATSLLNDAILFWRQAKESGLKVDMMAGVGAGYLNPKLFEALGDSVNGIISTGSSANINPNGLTPEAKELYQTVRDKFKAKHPDKQMSTNVMLGFNSMWVLLHDVLPKAGTMDAEKIAAAAESLDIPEGATPMGWGFKFDKEHNNSRAWPTLSQWQNGQLLTIYPSNLSLTDKIISIR